MNALSAQAGPGSEEADARWWWWAALALVVSLVAISRQSLWIDEAFMASKTSQPTLTDWWRMMPEGKGSDLQMPLYMIYAWGFARIFGISEWALRAGNIPWFVAGATAFITAFPKRQKIAAAAVALSAPFAWFYLNEARPYAMQLGASLIIFAALWKLSSGTNLHGEGKWFAALCFGLVALCGSSLLGVIWAGAALMCAPILFGGRRCLSLARAHLLASLLTGGLLAGLGAYYVWTLKSGTSELTADQTGNAALTAIKSAAHFRQGFAGGTDARNVAFLTYELTGLGGLGPGRVEIRTGGFGAFRPFALPLGVYALVTGAMMWFGLCQCFQNPGRLKRLGMTAIILLPMAVLLGAGYFLKFRVLGRHFTPVMPVLLFALVCGFMALRSRRDWLSKAAGIIFILLNLSSCLSFRFAVRHEKDDYRDAASAANEALKRGDTIWWSADAHGAAYYHVPLLTMDAAAKGGAVLVQNPSAEILSHLAAPDVIVASKPDIYDGGGALADFLREGHYFKLATLPAFTVWRRPG